MGNQAVPTTRHGVCSEEKIECEKTRTHTFSSTPVAMRRFTSHANTVTPPRQQPPRTLRPRPPRPPPRPPRLGRPLPRPQRPSQPQSTCPTGRNTMAVITIKGLRRRCLLTLLKRVRIHCKTDTTRHNLPQAWRSHDRKARPCSSQGLKIDQGTHDGLGSGAMAWEDLQRSTHPTACSGMRVSPTVDTTRSTAIYGTMANRPERIAFKWALAKRPSTFTHGNSTTHPAQTAITTCASGVHQQNPPRPRLPLPRPRPQKVHPPPPR